MKLPFKTETYGTDMRLVFTASHTLVYDGDEQWDGLEQEELYGLLENDEVTGALIFHARCSVNVLWILKDGL